VQYTVGGKTGTAQVVGIKKNEKYNAKLLAERLRDNALYTAFAPADKPRIVVAMVVENAGWGAAWPRRSRARRSTTTTAGQAPERQGNHQGAEGRCDEVRALEEITDEQAAPAAPAGAAMQPDLYERRSPWRRARPQGTKDAHAHNERRSLWRRMRPIWRCSTAADRSSS
jgi:hypothetical protein